MLVISLLGVAGFCIIKAKIIRISKGYPALHTVT